MSENFERISLLELSKRMTEAELHELLASFSCPLNPDIERFLHESAIPFSLQGLAATYLVSPKYENRDALVGYFTLTYKHFQIDLSSASLLSNTLKKRIKRFAVYDESLDRHIVAAPLIGQIGKNFAEGYDQLITGRELLSLACDIVEEVQMMIGGRIVYLECEDNARLLDFYQSNDFNRFGCRPVTDDSRGRHLVQLLQYLR